MPLSATRLSGVLGPEIETQIRSFLALGSVPYPQLTSFANALGKAIADKVVLEVTANAVARTVVNQTFAGTVSGSTSSTLINQTFNGTVL